MQAYEVWCSVKDQTTSNVYKSLSYLHFDQLQQYIFLFIDTYK